MGIKPIAQHTNKLTKRTELIVTTNRNRTDNDVVVEYRGNSDVQ